MLATSLQPSASVGKENGPVHREVEFCSSSILDDFCRRVVSLSSKKKDEYLDKSVIIPNIIQFPRQFKIAPENCCVHGILIWWSEAGVIDVSKNRIKIAMYCTFKKKPP